VAITLLAVDDSVTMRKVLEITFAGPDFRVVTANSPDVALQKLKTDKPDLVISDISLEPKSGYELCKAIKQLAPGTPVLLLSSKQSQFDAAKGSQSQADDHMDKPFDTQQMIDKVKKMLQSKGETKQQTQTAAAPQAGITAPGPRPVVPQSGPAPIPNTNAAGATPPQRQKTLIYTPGGGPAPGPAPGGAVRPTTAVTPTAGKPATSPTPSAGLPRQRPADRPEMRPTTPQPSAPAATAAAVTAGAAASQVNGQMAAKLEGLGLTPTQVDAVLALSREVVERVVWEVVPVLAETIIKEEISRLTK
jgi:CheY-like chemotaxis protein